MIGRRIDDSAIEEKVSRRSLVAGATFFGAAMAAIGEVAKAQDAGSGSYSNAAIALPDGAPKTREEQIRAVRIARAIETGHERVGVHARQRGCDRRSAHVSRRPGHAMVQGPA
jgi:hypothetical protein